MPSLIQTLYWTKNVMCLPIYSCTQKRLCKTEEGNEHFRYCYSCLQLDLTNSKCLLFLTYRPPLCLGTGGKGETQLLLFWQRMHWLHKVVAVSLSKLSNPTCVLCPVFLVSNPTIRLNLPTEHWGALDTLLGRNLKWRHGSQNFSQSSGNHHSIELMSKAQFATYVWMSPSVNVCLISHPGRDGSEGIPHFAEDPQIWEKKTGDFIAVRLEPEIYTMGPRTMFLWVLKMLSLTWHCRIHSWCYGGSHPNCQDGSWPLQRLDWSGTNDGSLLAQSGTIQERGLSKSGSGWQLLRLGFWWWSGFSEKETASGLVWDMLT